VSFRNEDDKAGIAGLRVVLDDISQHYDVRLNEQEDPNTHQKKKDLTGADGTFNLTYAGTATSDEPGQMPRQLRLRVMLGQHILAESVQTDPRGQDRLTFPPIDMKRGETTSRFATLGGGTPSRFSTGNAIRWLVDNEEAWGHSADVIKEATILDVMQLGIEVDKYALGVEREKPKIVLRFDPAKTLFNPALPLVDANTKLERHDQSARDGFERSAGRADDAGASLAALYDRLPESSSPPSASSLRSGTGFD
jgi:hypothetical protein